MNAFILTPCSHTHIFWKRVRNPTPQHTPSHPITSSPPFPSPPFFPSLSLSFFQVFYALRMKEMGAGDIGAFNLAEGSPRAGSSGDGQGWWLYMDVRSKTTSYGGLEIVRHPFTGGGCSQTSRQDVIALNKHQDSLRPGSAYLYRGEKMRYTGEDTTSSSQLMMRVVSTTFPDLIAKNDKEAYRNVRRKERLTWRLKRKETDRRSNECRLKRVMDVDFMYELSENVERRMNID